ncbi:MAG: hypothetical protein IKB09_14165 [Oscillospiraceae bacterium]|nr:hypothetical protein [Oscillospiraceae bacterium]
MYVIAEMQGGYRAIPIHKTDNWSVYKLRVGRTERRIVLQARGRKYVVYSTKSIRAQFPDIRTEQLDALSDEIMGELQCRILRAEDYVDIPKIAEIVELKNAKHWMETGVLPVTSLAAYYGHPLDPAAKQLVTHVRIDISDIIIMDHEPPVDCIQEELPY